MAEADSEDGMSSEGGEYQERDEGQERFEREIEDMRQKDTDKSFGAALESAESRVPALVRRLSLPAFFLSVMCLARTTGLGGRLTLTSFKHNHAWLVAEAVQRPFVAGAT